MMPCQGQVMIACGIQLHTNNALQNPVILWQRLRALRVDGSVKDPIVELTFFCVSLSDTMSRFPFYIYHTQLPNEN